MLANQYWISLPLFYYSFGYSFYSAMGYYVYMDENGDAEGNYSLVSLCDVNAWRRNNQQEYSYEEISNGIKNQWLNLMKII